MEDADKNSKSLVLITRVGSTPTTGIKRKPSSLSGGLSFYLRRVRREQHCTRSQKKRPDFVGTFLFYMRYILRVPTVPFHLILPPQKVVFARRICARRAARLSREWPFVLPKSRTLPGKKHRKTASAIYSAVSYRFYNVFCKKSFTNEFQKHII